MSYLQRLIERATDTSLDLENNQIGNYRITPQHGTNLAQYFIYKDNCMPRHSRGRILHNCHVVDISIYGNKVDIYVNETYLNPTEVSDVIDTLTNIYSTFDITTKNF